MQSSHDTTRVRVHQNWMGFCVWLTIIGSIDFFVWLFAR